VDVDALVKVIDEAREFVYVAVMDYFPGTLYGKHFKHWPLIDDALRRGNHHQACFPINKASFVAALERGVHVRLLLSDWPHSRADMWRHLQSLMALNGARRGTVSVEGRKFLVPAFDPSQAAIPFARVNHNKYMVTDKEAYVGTSNWSADYFISTGGISLVARNAHDSQKEGLRKRLEAIFLRDWHSAYSHHL